MDNNKSFPTPFSRLDLSMESDKDSILNTIMIILPDMVIFVVHTASINAVILSCQAASIFYSYIDKLMRLTDRR